MEFWMNRLTRFMSLAAALLSAVPVTARAQVVPGAPATDWQRELAAYSLTVLRSYNALNSEWRAALLEGAADRAAEHYAVDARLLVSGHQELLGRDSIADFLAVMAKDLVDVRTSLAEFMASDRLAFASGPLIYTHRATADGLTRMEVGNHVTILVREGRRWRIKSQVLKYDEPRDEPPGDS
jgi:uncharacterized protein (TIGR02246 family)